MPTTRFVSNEFLWNELTALVRKARSVDAAIAYVGSGGSQLLPLKSGDRLVVDLSLGTVRAGSTDPSQIEMLLNRGVRIFSRQGLHAKIVIADSTLLCGSANVSKRSRSRLDEAGLITNESVAVRRARDFIDRISTEPVRQAYLDECKKHYRAPRFVDDLAAESSSRRRARHAKLWLVLIDEGDVPERERSRYMKGAEKAAGMLHDMKRFSVESIHYRDRQLIHDQIEVGDWVIQMFRLSDGGIDVLPPARFLLGDSYSRRNTTGKKRWVLHLEAPDPGVSIPWSIFRRKAGSILRIGPMKAPRSRAVVDVDAADRLLALWTPSGKVAKK